jgi:hypothetical protein
MPCAVPYRLNVINGQLAGHGTDHPLKIRAHQPQVLRVHCGGVSLKDQTIIFV